MPAVSARSIVLTLLAALALPLVPALVGATSGTAQAASYRNAPDSYERSILYWTNVNRKRHGVRPLTVASCVDRYAESWARQLASRNAFYHQGLMPIMRTCNKRAAAENIGKGNVSARRMVQLWMSSPEHRRNLLNPRYHHIGIGSVYSRGGTLYDVQDFAS
jgi:uncharacterized protein YkwD